MKILKNILIYALPALMLCNTSCDYLDKEPENKVPEEKCRLYSDREYVSSGFRSVCQS